MHVVREDVHLVAHVRTCVMAALLECHAQQGRCLLLAGGNQNIELTRRRARVHLPRQAEQAVSLPTHGRYDHDELIALRGLACDTIGDGVNALAIGDRRAAVFLYDESHNYGRSNITRIPCASESVRP